MGDTGKEIIKMLKRACKEGSEVVKFQSLGYMFKLLVLFSRSKNKFAPFLYKSLTFVCIENH